MMIKNYVLRVDYMNGVTVISRFTSYIEAELYLNSLKRYKLEDIGYYEINHISYLKPNEYDCEVNPVEM